MATRKVIRKRKGKMVAAVQQSRSRPGGAPRKRKIGRKILVLLLLGLAVRWAWISLDLGERLTLPYGRAVPVDSVRKIASDPQGLRAAPDSAEDSASADTTVAAAEGKTDRSDQQPGVVTQAREWARRQLDNIFVVRNVELRGALSIPGDTLLARLGDIQGKPMLELDLFALAGRIRSHPRVQRAELLRRLPGTLEVRVTERRELAVISARTGLTGIDGQGVVLAPPAPGWPVDVPVITGSRISLAVGDTLRDENLVYALAWIRKAEREPRVQSWLSEVHVNPAGVEWVEGVNGWRVRLGTHAIGAQVAALDAYLGQQNQEDRSNRTLDLRFPGFLIVRRRS